ncbi:MAG: FecCD family ABC transporter permease [Clostridium sp.]|uniref:FecCD family ABC transporter permease n=1 Tax=Clostridium sp. TaxID=1506 RepID=UPI003F2D4B31
MKERKYKIVLITTLSLLVIGSIISLSMGSYKLSINEVIATLLGNGDRLQNTAVLDIRLPRILVGIFVGMALGVAGSMLQTVTKNELADTGIIGINAGAAVMAVLFITYKTTNYYGELGELSIFVLPFVATIGAFLAAFIIYILSSKGGIKPKRLLLIGIGLNAGLNAFISFITFRGGVSDYNRILVWTSGSLWGSSWKFARVIIPIVSIVILLVLINHKRLDVLSFSDETAISLGLNIERERKKFIILAVILAGVSTAFAGNIAFLGLIAPHIGRKLVGAYHKHFIVIAGVIGGVVVVASDIISRNLFSPIEIPVGIIVSIFGVPYFIYLMMKEN